MPDEPTPQPTSTDLPTPPGVHAGTTAHRRAQRAPDQIVVGSGNDRPMMNEAGIRNEADGMSAMLKPNSYEAPPNENYKEPVSAGDSLSDIFMRTEIASPQEAKRIAVSLALSSRHLRGDDRDAMGWATEDWVKMPITAAAYTIYLRLMKSHERKALKEAVMTATGMVAPDWTGPQQQPVRRWLGN